jgi:hypothetical protein
VRAHAVPSDTVEAFRSNSLVAFDLWKASTHLPAAHTRESVTPTSGMKSPLSTGQNGRCPGFDVAASAQATAGQGRTTRKPRRAQSVEDELDGPCPPDRRTEPVSPGSSDAGPGPPRRQAQSCVQESAVIMLPASGNRCRRFAWMARFTASRSGPLEKR